MLSRAYFNRRSLSPALLLVSCVFLIVFSLQNLWQGPSFRLWISAQQYQDKQLAPPSPPVPPHPLPTEPPDDYRHAYDQSPFCEHRLGVAYLEELRHTRASYCSDLSPSQMTCFHAGIEANDRVDSFCISQGASFDQNRGRFQISCDTIEPWGIETNEPSRTLNKFIKYWYETGPSTILDKFVDINNTTQPFANDDVQNGTTIILIKREGSVNTWHSLMEIMSLSMSIDVLQMAPRQGDPGTPLLSLADSENTQVVILDDHDDGPYFDLWRLFAKKPTLRLADLPADTTISNVIIPLPGASNPIWRNDWEPNTCAHSTLLQTFSQRVLTHLDISTIPAASTVPTTTTTTTTTTTEEEDASSLSAAAVVVVTFLHRQGTRKLIDIDTHIAALQHRYQHARIQLVDLAALPFREQVQLVRDSDILAGVHGAGLTHALWMREHAAVVEILPAGLQHKGFRNLAGALGHSYFSAHGEEVVVDAAAAGDAGQDGNGEVQGNWQQDDVVLGQSEFLALMDVAIRSMYNTGRHNFDLLE